MRSYPIALGAAAVGLTALGLLGIFLFGELWIRIGIGAAVVVVVGGALLIAWQLDRKARASRAGLERI